MSQFAVNYAHDVERDIEASSRSMTVGTAFSDPAVDRAWNCLTTRTHGTRHECAFDRCERVLTFYVYVGEIKGATIPR
jgi:hypothetical protein